MEKTKITFKKFARRFGFYILALLMIVALVLTLTLTADKSEPVVDNNKLSDVVDVGAEVQTFGSPLSSAVVIKGFSSTDLQYNATLKQWEAHKSIDLVSDEGKSVVASLDGKVVEKYSTYQDGGVVVIEHKNGLRTTYSNLENITVELNDAVVKGQKIGETSMLAASETHEQNYVRFQVSENGKVVDPNDYFDFEGK